MVETKTIGEKRLEYLDLANKALSGGDVTSTESFIESFLTTIRDDSEIAKEIQQSFDAILKKGEDTWNKLTKDTSELDTATQTEQRWYGLDNIRLQNLNERKNKCWQIAMKYKLFEGYE